ncbi:MAG: hypothetical protein GX854_00535 [Clostridiales bacterium]|nr:hypothetical protein [Clostridiales bacterium]
MTGEQKLKHFFNKLKGIKQTGPNQYQAHCPAHEDRVASLSISRGKNKVNFYCHAGCSGDEILQAMGLTWSDIYFDNNQRQREIVAAYDYTDENGNLLYQVVRFEPKTFRQRRPDGNGGWKWGLGDTRRVLYRLKEISEAIKAGKTVYIVEGEKDVESLRKLGLMATCNPMGAGKWEEDYTKTLTGARVVIIPDNDKPGQDHAKTIAQKLCRKTKSVKILKLPDLKEKEDVSDWLARGGTREELIRLTENCPEYEPESVTSNQNNEDKSNLATKIYNAALENAKLFTDERDEAYAAISLNGHCEVWSVKGKRFSLWLQQIGLHCNEWNLPYIEAINQAKKQLEAVAYFQGENITLHNRVAQKNGDFWYDLSNKEWQAVRINENGWEITRPPILFRRNAHQKPQVKPQESGKGNPWRILDYVNVKKEDELLLMVSIISAFIPDIPHIVTIIHGPQGSAKTTLLEFMREIIDPSRVPLLRIPRDDRDIIQNFDHHYATFFDNISHIPKWVSDMFCRAVTGEGMEARALYTDDEPFIRQYKRVIGLNGINVAATEPDLLDRSILIELEPIPKTERKEIKIRKSEFERAKPEILGGVFDTIVKAKNIYPEVELKELHRMADFTRWGYAIAEALGRSGNEFLQSYLEDERDRNLEVIEDNPLGQALLLFMEQRDKWEGSPGDLLKELEKIAEAEGYNKDSKKWPGNPTWVTRRINEIESLLRSEGIKYKASHDGKKRILSFRKSTKNSVNSVFSVSQEEDSRHDRDYGTNTKLTLTNTKEVSVKNSVKDEKPDMTGITEDTNANNANNTKFPTFLKKNKDGIIIEGVI